MAAVRAPQRPSERVLAAGGDRRFARRRDARAILGMKQRGARLPVAAERGAGKVLQGTVVQLRRAVRADDEGDRRQRVEHGAKERLARWAEQIDQRRAVRRVSFHRGSSLVHSFAAGNTPLLATSALLLLGEAAPNPNA